jgi:2-amino-4,5-dihydroxy-6-oxo-7-(phosphonooxy)heptanoate synthase
MADAIRAGAGGIAAGRLVFTADDPGAMVRRLATLVHDRTPVVSR